MALGSLQRWQILLVRLNQIEARADDPDRVIMARFLRARIAPALPERLVLRPREGDDRELGPPCTSCSATVASSQLLSGCTVCLRVIHYECWRRAGGCPTPACVSERLPFRQLRTG
jgi:hypothetical protein